MKENKGITLISLVVTIIVLIVLASVSVNIIIGQNGIFTKAQYAAEQSKTAGYAEELMLIVAEVKIDAATGTTNKSFIESIKDELSRKNPSWYSVKNEALLVNMRKIKVIFNKDNLT